MASKKVLKGKQATLPRRSDHTKAFQRDWKNLQHRGINLASLKEVMALHDDKDIFFARAGTHAELFE